MNKTDLLKRMGVAFIGLLGIYLNVMADDSRKMSVTVENTSKETWKDYPVSVDLSKYESVRGAIVKYGDEVLPYQLDDMDGDGKNDELFFLADLGKKEKRRYDITLLSEADTTRFEPRVYVELMLTNKKVKSENKQDLYISHLTVDRGVNPYWMLHHHGAAFENELVAYRIYFDHRQTVDIYGKYHQGLELRDTQFYPDAEQKAAGYGDDVLWVGQTLGLGTLRGWDGNAPTMLKEVEHRSQRIISRGPLRTIVEVKDEGWEVVAGTAPIDMTIRYTLIAGHRECRVDVSFDRPALGIPLSTGIINVKGSREFSDHHGLRGCWGTDWPVSAKDSVGHKRETVGLGICVPESIVRSEEPANKDNYAYTLSVSESHFTYYVTFGSDNEDFGYHSAESWFAYLRDWKRQLERESDCVKVF